MTSKHRRPGWLDYRPGDRMYLVDLAILVVAVGYLALAIGLVFA